MAENSLLNALPPKTDYLTYLTLLEYHLTLDQLPTLHDILQDTTLTANIGWDLVHLLLPLLPASRECLQDVARLGNPREVVLKVTELLEALGRRADVGVDSDEEDTDGSRVVEGDQANVEQNGRGIIRSSEIQSPTGPPSKKMQFIALLEMLAVLHPRIRTKYPSRFLSTSLQAILPVYSLIAADPAATEAILSFIKTLSGAARPKLPPRKSSSVIPLQVNVQIAPDPEGQGDDLGPNEVMLQNRLLQSLLTYAIEVYVFKPSTDDIPGQAWCSRFQERLHPEKIIPGRRSYSQRFTEEEELQESDAIVGHIVALSRDLKISPKELFMSITGPEPDFHEGEDHLPSSASDVQLSQPGSLYLFCAIMAASSLFDVPTPQLPLKIFPDYATILANFLSPILVKAIGTENDSFIDAILFLGFFIQSKNPHLIPPLDDEEFNIAMQRLSLLSANTPSPILRYHAHVLASSLLHSHPSDIVRLAFIRDTLLYCPYENLKASAVGWLKQEFLTAESNAKAAPPSDPLFASPSTIAELSPMLFGDPRFLNSSSPSDLDPAAFLANRSFHLAALNLYYLIVSSPSLFRTLAIDVVSRTYGLAENFLQPLREMAEGEAVGETEGGGMGVEGVGLLIGTIDRVEALMREKGVLKTCG